jgi:hypothetical protein
MTVKTGAFSVAAVLGIALGVTTLRQHRSHPHGDIDPSSRRAPSEQDPTPSSDSARGARTSAQGSSAPSLMQAPIQPATGVPTSPPLPTAEEMYEASEGHLSGERIDPEWSVISVQTYRSVFKSQITGVELLDVRCGSTLCKLSVAFQDPAMQQQLAQRLTELEPFKSGTVLFRYHSERQPHTADLYIPRDGMALPTHS